MDQARCIVCGLDIKEDCDGRYESIFRHNRSWRQYEAYPGFLFLNAEEIESHYFPQTRGFWQGLYRLSAW